MDVEIEDDKPPPYVQYDSSDASIKWVKAGQALCQASRNILGELRCTSVKYLAVALALSLMATLVAFTVLLLQRFELSSKEDHLRSTDLPDVTELRLLAAVDNSIIVSRQRPQAHFDYYLVSIAEDDDLQHSSNQMSTTGSCANCTIIHPDQTRVTFTNLKECATVNITIRVHRNGPPKHTSRGVGLQGIFIPGREPDPPRNITMVPTSTSRTQLQWDHPDKVAAVILAYNVKICRTFGKCTQTDNLDNCTEYMTSEASLTFNSTEDTVYCILVTGKVRCGIDEINTRTAVVEIRTPIVVLPDVTNLRLVSVSPNSFTAAWTKPKVNFDYYWIEVIDVNDGMSLTPGTVGSCVNGSIIHPDQTQVTCSQLQPCSKMNFRVRTHIIGPPAHTSYGVSLYDILIPASVRPEVTNLQLGIADEEIFVLKWERPQACFDYYAIEVIDENTNERIAVTCNNGDVVKPYQTRVTCEQIKMCANVTIRVKTHTGGPPERSSTGATLRHVLLEGKVQPEVTNLQLGAVDADTFSLKWERPKDCFGYYTVEVRDESTNETRAVTCNNGDVIKPDQMTVTCEQIETCANVTIRVRTHTRGRPERSSTGSVLKRVLLQGKAPPEPTNLKLVSAKGGDFTATFQVQPECIENRYHYVGDASKDGRDVLPYRICNLRDLAFNLKELTCTGIEACDKVDLKIWTNGKEEPHSLSLVPAILRSINVRGNC
uniref:Fibronectin type-III domain-containing protein n=1 Tax=Rhipicephalus pulchellus TaxID=72859 RepID=L7LYJ1_RHIPC